MKTFFTVIAVVKHKDKYLILRRAPHRSQPGKWNYVTGHIKDAESAENACLRELKEETNLQGEILNVSFPYWTDYQNIRRVKVASLIKVSDISSLKVDDFESDDHQWITQKKIIEFGDNHSIFITAKQLKII